MNTANERIDEMADVLNDLRGMAARWLDAVHKKPKLIPRSLMTYGFVLTDGTAHFGHPCFMAVTGSGECLVLTHELLRALEFAPLSLCGETVCTLESREAIHDEYQPVLQIELMLAVGFGRRAPGDYAAVATRVGPEDLEYSRWTFLTKRPVGWPA